MLAHYVGDAHVPLHSVVNHDGELTGQDGLHSRWETQLFERNRARLKVAPAPPKGVTDPRGFIFDTLLASNRASSNVLESDRRRPPDASSTTTPTSRRSRRARCRCSSAG